MVESSISLEDLHRRYGETVSCGLIEKEDGTYILYTRGHTLLACMDGETCEATRMQDGVHLVNRDGGRDVEFTLTDAEFAVASDGCSMNASEAHRITYSHRMQWAVKAMVADAHELVMKCASEGLDHTRYADTRCLAMFMDEIMLAEDTIQIDHHINPNLLIAMHEHGVDILMNVYGSDARKRLKEEGYTLGNGVIAW